MLKIYFMLFFYFVHLNAQNNSFDDEESWISYKLINNNLVMEFPYLIKKRCLIKLLLLKIFKQLSGELIIKFIIWYFTKWKIIGINRTKYIRFKFIRVPVKIKLNIKIIKRDEGTGYHIKEGILLHYGEEISKHIEKYKDSEVDTTFIHDIILDFFDLKIHKWFYEKNNYNWV